jgi:hypothetical protein
MATSPITYRVSPEVDAELRVLAAKYGGVDRALRYLLEAIPVADLDAFDERRKEMWERTAQGARAFKGALLKPKDRK